MFMDTKLGFLDMRYFLVAFTLSTSIFACDVSKDEQFCGALFLENDGCVCYSDDQGWCIGYHTDTSPPNKGDCEADGGIELLDCPIEGLVGTCSENDDFHSPSISLYESYEGDLERFASLETALVDCDGDGLYSWSEASN